MALPKTTVFRVSITLPSGKETKLRAFHGAEEKALLTAKMSGQTSGIFSTILDVLDACCDLETSNLIKPDLEYLFLKSFELSVSNIIEVSLNCKHCDESIKAKIPIDKVKVPKKIDKDFSIFVGKDIDGKEITLVLQPPSMGKIAEAQDKENAEMYILYAALKGVYLGNELQNTDFEEFSTWLLDQKGIYIASLNYLKDLPSITFEQQWKCEKCKKSNEVKLSGLSDFFSS